MDYLHVAAAVVVDRAGRVLVARRPDHLHQGGLWEFPGGKVEAGETVRAALARELDEEVGITVSSARPLIRIPHDYGDRRVLLDVWWVDGFDGTAHGREGQPVRWVEPAALSDLAMPAANRPIVTAVQLPDCYLVTPEPGGREQWPAFLSRLEARLADGIRLVQFRTKRLAPDLRRALAAEANRLCRRYGADLLVNADIDLAQSLALGVHLTSSQLAAADRRTLLSEGRVGASCHGPEELRLAERIGVDFVVLSPVMSTASHPGAAPIGWDGLHALCESTSLPVYALGGMSPANLPEAWAAGAQGIAAIRGLWGA